MTPGCNRRIASIVCTIIVISSLIGTVTDVNISSPRGTTNIIRNIITNSVGSGELLLVQGTNILGISTNNFGPSNAITSVIINFSGPGVGGTVINPIFADSTNLYGIGTINANNGGFTNSLLFNGVQVLTNIPAVGSTNTLTKWLTSNSLSYIVNLSGILKIGR